jgi:hypothetical protein
VRRRRIRIRRHDPTLAIGGEVLPRSSADVERGGPRQQPALSRGELTRLIIGRGTASDGSLFTTMYLAHYNDTPSSLTFSFSKCAA